MKEEMFDEATYGRLNDSGQQNLISAYCADIEHRILSAGTADEAKAISEEACRTFRLECASALVGKALTDHVKGLYEKYWGNKDGRNILESHFNIRN